jgi:hypothetical protein
LEEWAVEETLDVVVRFVEEDRRHLVRFQVER